MTDPEVERIAELCWRAFLQFPFPRQQPSWSGNAADPDNWRAVARAVIADRVVREPVPQDAPNKQRAWLIERLREEDAKLRAINLRLTAERDAARAKLGVVNARLYAVEAERDALQRRLDALATREPTTEELRWLHSVTGGNNALHSVTGGNNALDAWRFVRDALLAEPSRPTEDRS